MRPVKRSCVVGEVAPGDTIFAIGTLVLGWFVLGLRTGWSLEKRGAVAPGSTEIRVPGVEPRPERA